MQEKKTNNLHDVHILKRQLINIKSAVRFMVSGDNLDIIYYIRVKYQVPNNGNY